MQEFQKVYPFATENVKDSLAHLDLQNKSVLTVGSSMDQAFDAILYGSTKVTVFDINANTKKFYELKKALLYETDRRSFYDKLLKQNILYDDITLKSTVYRVCKYLESDETYELLKQRLVTASISFVTGDIFKIDDFLSSSDKFDSIILSNILQYLEYFVPKDENVYSYLREIFLGIENHLENNGIMELCYLYSVIKNGQVLMNTPLAIYNLPKVLEIFGDKTLFLEGVLPFIEKSSYTDAILTYRKN